jgi:1,2-diacylglycerol 3-alpha-glucosyltransferase
MRIASSPSTHALSAQAFREGGGLARFHAGVGRLHISPTDARLGEAHFFVVLPPIFAARATSSRLACCLLIRDAMNTGSRLRIAFVADSLHSQSGGGILSGEFVVDRLRQDHDVVTVAADGDDVVPSFQLPLRSMTDMNFVMARPDRAVLARAFSHVDVVHLQFPFWLSFGALDQARRMGLPVVASFHVQPENMLYNVGIHSEWLNGAIYRRMVKHYFNRVDGVVCPTPFARDKLRGYGLTSPAFVVSNGVPPDVAEAMAKHPPEPHIENGGPFFILAVGRFAAEKRQDIIIEAVRRSRHRDRIRLVLSGWGPLEADLQHLAGALPNGAEIGFLPREELVNDYRKADLFVHAGEVELEGMSVLEAMSAGLPALVADAPESAASRFALNEQFRFAHGDAAALSAKIDFLIENPETLVAAREPYRLRAHEFDFNASVGKLVEVYRTVIASAAVPLRETA